MYDKKLKINKNSKNKSLKKSKSNILNRTKKFFKKKIIFKMNM